MKTIGGDTLDVKEQAIREWLQADWVFEQADKEYNARIFHGGSYRARRADALCGLLLAQEALRISLGCWTILDGVPLPCLAAGQRRRVRERAA